MNRKYFCVEVVILLLLSHVGWNGPSTTIVSCPRDKSRLVRSIVDKKFLPILEHYKVSLPLDCPFHKERDVFWWPEKHVGDGQKHKCPVCSLTFSCEETLISHWDAVHGTLQKNAEDAVCLADFCDIMRCNVLASQISKTGETATPVSDNKHQSLSSSTHSSHSSENLCDENTLSLLQNKCKAVIRQCTLGLLTALSLKDFHDIEDELNKVVCSYLTCDRFWDNSLQEIHQVPILFCIIIVFIMVGGFCFCYYIVWILFDSSPYEEINCNGFNVRNVACSPRPSIFPQYQYHRLRNNNRMPRR